MENNKRFANHVEQLILSEKLPQAGMLLLSFLRQYNAPSEEVKNLEKQVVVHINNLNDMNHRLIQKTMEETEAARVEKSIWLGFQQINGQIRQLNEVKFDFSKADKNLEHISTYVPKPETWHNAGWLPVAIAGVIIAILFLIGLNYNSGRIKERKAAEQAVVDAKNGVVGAHIEGVIAYKLLEEKKIVGADGAMIMSIKSVKGTANDLELIVSILNKSKTPIKNLNFDLVDIAHKEKPILALEKAQDLGDIPISKDAPTEKKIHFNYAVDDSRTFLLRGTFMMDTPIEKSIGVPFDIR
jgi:tetrahydromethanopterin S-methyltransferase subunit B